jgi:sugar phosphate isomerase/epimerase
MIHPRLSISALSSFRWSFDEDFALWRELGIGWAGLIAAKLGDDLDDGLSRLGAAGIRAATAIGAGFDLRAPESWDGSRGALHGLIDAVAAHDGWSVYITPGRTTGATWREVLEVFAEAVAPSVAYAQRKGVRLAIEPSLRTDVSFVNPLRDAVDVAERTGIKLVVDFGNCWMERDLREVMLRAAPHAALVQVGDVQIASSPRPGTLASGRVPFGEGELPLARMLGDVLDMGYAGPLDLEIPGPLGEAEGYEPVIRRGVEKASALLYEVGL